MYAQVFYRDFLVKYLRLHSVRLNCGKIPTRLNEKRFIFSVITLTFLNFSVNGWTWPTDYICSTFLTDHLWTIEIINNIGYGKYKWFYSNGL